MQEWQEQIERRLGRLEQRTEEIKAVRVEVASEDAIRRLDAMKQELTQELHTVSHTWLSTLQEHYDEHKQAISGVQTVLKGHAKFFEEHGKRLAATATKDDLTAMQGQIKQDTGTIETRLDRIETTTATKDDLAAMKNGILDAMKQLLQDK
jgi:chromosome segregation ATPase